LKEMALRYALSWMNCRLASLKLDNRLKQAIVWLFRFCPCPHVLFHARPMFRAQYRPFTAPSLFERTEGHGASFFCDTSTIQWTGAAELGSSAAAAALGTGRGALIELERLGCCGDKGSEAEEEDSSELHGADMED
jgi:hypothetical protein